MRPHLPVVPLEPVGLVRRIPLAPHQLVEPVTPQRDLFVLAHFGIPKVDVSSWRLEIGGLVERPCRFTLDDLRKLPKRTVMSFHQCAGFPRRPDVATRRVGNVVWGGVDLGELLRAAGIRAGARFIWAYGLDHGDFEGKPGEYYVKDVPLMRLDRGDMLLAYEVNGEPLTLDHGFPLRLVVPGYYGTNRVKWLCRIDLADRRPDGIFTTILYNDPLPPSAERPAGNTRPVWEAPPEAAIVSPPPGPLSSRAAIEIWGWAWGANGVDQVEVSTDGGASWSKASLEKRQQWSWQRFAFQWIPSAPGSFTLMARATDKTGATQPASRARNAIHAVTVEVEAS